MAVAFHDVKSAAGLKKLDEYLLSRSYISGLVEHVLGLTVIVWIWFFCVWHMIILRYQPSKDDVTVYEAISKPVSSEYVNVSRWSNHIEALLRVS